ncbi:hypothetical protein RRG08_044919 [Elysia crispata]|uniref:Uncharacterized protein n=1 Tax=Elysia crispata TaxID=231223 RepID=A0AAE1DMV0_9GAST|nr:hypothetical protein RRG08_044919 [Elysia crispata]
MIKHLPLGPKQFMLLKASDISEFKASIDKTETKSVEPLDLTVFKEEILAMKQRDLDYEDSEDMRKEGPTADRCGSIKMRRTLDQEGKDPQDNESHEKRTKDAHGLKLVS